MLLDNPYTEEIYAEIPYLSKNEALTKVDHAIYAQCEWKGVPLHKRQYLCLEWLNVLEKNKDKIALEITQQMGKPITQSYNEINGVMQRAKCVLFIDL